MKTICLDFESFFCTKSGYTLRKQTTEQYVRDKRFQAHGAAIKWSSDTAPRWYDDRQLRYVLAQEDWANTAVLCHHAAFDCLILSHHYGIRPRFIFDSLSCARLLLGNHLSVGLDSLARHFGLQAKTVPYNLFNGKHWDELRPAVQQEVADGCCHDVDLTWDIFKILAKDMPREEFAVIDTTVKMFTDPVLRADTTLLGKIWEREAAHKQDILAELKITEADVQSAAKFTQLLEAEGVEVEYKDGKHGRIPAFAKTDPFMRDVLLEHDSKRVRGLAEARLGCKSTLMQTRAESLGWMASRGPLTVYLNYAGAGTLRPSGGGGTNFLNFKRNSDLRRAILAPEGYLLAPVDSSQIELRVCLYLAGQTDVLDKLRRGEDVYAELAGEFYGETIYKPAKDDPRRVELEQKRGAGKQGWLMCIYGAAGPKFKATAKAGLYGPSVEMTDEEADRYVKITRNKMPTVTAKNSGYWAQASRMLARLAGGDPCQWGSLTVRDHRIYLPNGCPLIYDTLEFFRPNPADRDKYKEWEWDGFWRVKTRDGWKAMWGSKLVQNICEAVSRVIVTQAMIRIVNAGYRVLNHPYDELLCMVPKNDGQAEEHLAFLLGEMNREPDWLPGIPLAAEGILGDRYAK